MSVNDKIDRLLELIYQMKPIVEESHADVKNLTSKVSDLDSKYSHIDKQLSDHIADKRHDSGRMEAIIEFVITNWKGLAMSTAAIASFLGIKVIFRG